MGANTKIEWCDHTVNFWMGCEPVSEGCNHCYARRFWRLHGMMPNGGSAKAGGRRRVSENTIQATLKRAKPGDFVFVNSLSDFFDEKVPDEWRDRAMGWMSLRPWLTFLLLTKRPAEMARYLGTVRERKRGYWHGLIGLFTGAFEVKKITDKEWKAVWDYHAKLHAPRDPKALGDHSLECFNGAHIWLGVTAENQARADERIPELLKIDWPGKKFVSIEPMLGPIDLEATFSVYDKHGEPSSPRCKADGSCVLDWVILGGESGPQAWPMNPAWARSVRDQCQEAGVPFFFKQWGRWAPPPCGGDLDPDEAGFRCQRHYFDAAGRDISDTDGWYALVKFEMWPLGKKAAGAMLDGREWKERP